MTTTKKLQELESRDLKPVPHANERERILVEGLRDLFALHGLEIPVLHIDSNGEFNITTKDNKKFGPELAAKLNLIPFRTGIQAIQGYVQDYNTWGRINHFEAEHLLRTLDSQKP